MLEAGDLSLTVGSDDDDPVYALVDAGFKEEWDVIDDDSLRIFPRSRSREAFLLDCDAGMNDAFESPEFSPVSKHDGAQRMAIERPVRIKHILAEGLYDLPPSRSARFDHQPSQLVGIEDDGSAPSEHPCDGAFSGCDPACQTDEYHVVENSMGETPLSLGRRA